MNRNALCISIGFDDHESTYIVDYADVAQCNRFLSAEELKDQLLDLAEEVLDGDQGELFLDITGTDPNAIEEFWKQYDELVD